MSELVRVELAGGIATVTLDNPPVNAVTLALTKRLGEILDELAADPAARVLIMTGAGEKAFCAGSDIKEFPELLKPGVAVPRKMVMENHVYSKLDDFPKPTIAALNGIAYGGGLEIAIACDLLVAEEGGRLALPEVKLGVFPGSGGTVRVTRRIGEGRAKEMMFTGDPITAETALAWGLVNRVVPKGTALAAARALAAVIARRSSSALQLCKAAIDMGLDLAEDDAVQKSLALTAQAFASPDCREGVRAFIAKEEPKFT